MIAPTIRAGETLMLPRGDEPGRRRWATGAGPGTRCSWRNSGAGRRHLLPARQPAGRRRPLANCGYATAMAATRPRHRPRHVRPLAGARPAAGLPGHAVQLRGQHNERAVRRGRAMEFDIVGRVPGFDHPDWAWSIHSSCTACSERGVSAAGRSDAAGAGARPAGTAGARYRRRRPRPRCGGVGIDAEYEVVEASPRPAAGR